MSGRGDNNKHGSSGRGASNQSNQPMENTGAQKKSNHNKHAEEGKRSEPQSPQQDQSSNRNKSTR